MQQIEETQAEFYLAFVKGERFKCLGCDIWFKREKSLQNICSVCYKNGCRS